jgi:serine/threonine protein kinase/outer membrane protein assembly factor BamB
MLKISYLKNIECNPLLSSLRTLIKKGVRAIMADRIGQQLGNYRLVRLLGRGGFADVYLGEHLRLKTHAAIKVLSARLASQEAVELFEQEARTIAHLRHPHIVRILDYDVEGEIPFLVMDYAAGGTLRRRHPKGTVLPLTIITSYVTQIADALQSAHDQHIIHRDIKPENMLVAEHDHLLLSDFGIAIVAQSSRYQSTQEMGGTMGYIAPEQIQGKPRPASDQYALGIVVYEWLTGDCPFHGSMTEIIAQHLAAAPPRLREKVPSISPDVEQVVLTALEKDPHRRFGNIQAFATALKQAGQSGQQTAAAYSAIPQPVPQSYPEPSASPLRLFEPGGQSEIHTVAPLMGQQPTPLLSSNQQPLPVTLAAKETRPVATRPGSFTFSHLFARLHPSAPERRRVGWQVSIASLALLLVFFILRPYIWNSSQVIMQIGKHGSAATPTATPARTPFAPKVMYVASIPYHNANQTGLAISAIQTSTGSVLWQRQWSDESVFSPIEDIGGTIYAATTHFSSTTGYSDSGFVHALRASDGSILWSYPVSNRNGAYAVYASDGYVYVSASGLYVLQASTGSLVWKYDPQNAYVTSQPAIANGEVYLNIDDFGSHQGKIEAFQASNGKMLWQYNMVSDVDGAPGSIIVDNGVIYAASPQSFNRFQYPYDPSKDSQNTPSTIYALQANNGSLLWKYQIDKDSSFFKSEGSSLESINGILYAVSASQKNSNSAIHVISEKAGSLLWKYQVHVDGKYGALPSTLIADGIIYISSQGSTAMTYALKAEDGTVLWTHNLQGGYDPDIAAAYGVAYIAIGTESRSQDHVDAVRIRDGSLLWNYHIDSSAYAPALLATGTALYIGSYNYQQTCAVLALRANNGSLLWHFPMSPVTSVIAATS